MQTNSVNNQLNTECFLLRRKEQCMTEFMSTVSGGVPVILLFLTKSSKEFEEKSGSSKTFGFSQTNYHLTKGFPYVFIAYLNPKSNSSVKQFPSLLTTTSLFWGGIFSDVVICLFNTLARMKTGCTDLNTAENT